MNEEQKERQKKILKDGTGFDCMLFAREVIREQMRADIPALLARVVEIGTRYDCLAFAYYIPVADVKALLKRAEELKNEA